MRNSHPPACALLSRAIQERHLPQGDRLALERATMTLANLLATDPQSSRARAVGRYIVDDMNQHRDAVDPENVVFTYHTEPSDEVSSIEVRYKDHLGESLVGTFNPSTSGGVAIGDNELYRSVFADDQCLLKTRDPLALSRLAALAQSETTRLMEYCEDGQARQQLQACLDRLEEATELLKANGHLDKPLQHDLPEVVFTPSRRPGTPPGSPADAVVLGAGPKTGEVAFRYDRHGAEHAIHVSRPEGLITFGFPASMGSHSQAFLDALSDRASTLTRENVDLSLVAENQRFDIRAAIEMGTQHEHCFIPPPSSPAPTQAAVSRPSGPSL